MAPELDYITVRGFKSIASIEKLALRPINVVIGPNGSGKSNFMEMFSFLREVREGRLQDYVRRGGGAEQILHFGSRVTPRMEIVLSFQNERNQYALALEPTEDDNLYPASEKAFFWDKRRYPTRPFDEELAPRGREAGISDPNVTRTARWVRDHLSRWRLYHTRMRSTRRSRRERSPRPAST